MYNAANNAWSKLAQGITADATSLTVEDASSFPEPPFVVSIDDEIIEVGSKTANTLSDLVRGVEGTTPAAHVSGVRVENRFTAGTYQGVVDAVLAAETPSGAQAKVENYAVAKAGDTMQGTLAMSGQSITFGNKFRIKYNSSLNTLDIEVI